LNTLAFFCAIFETDHEKDHSVAGFSRAKARLDEAAAKIAAPWRLHYLRRTAGDRPGMLNHVPTLLA
jgi:hypothetical protein